MIPKEQLFRNVFVKTGGFMLNWPFGESMRIGDFFAMRTNHIGVVGNIYDTYFQLDIKDSFAKDIYKFQAPVLEPYIDDDRGWEVYTPIKSLWHSRRGCTTNYFSNQFISDHKRKTLGPDVSTYQTHLRDPGDYFFVANGVQYLRMPHFREIHKEVIRRLTTEFYNFSKIYLVTDVAYMDDYSLGISRTEDAEFTFARDQYFNGDIIDILASDASFEVERVKGMEHLEIRKKGGTMAFKAKKMGLSIKAKDILIKEIHNSADKEFRKYAVELIDNELFHLFPKIEINPANANEFFHWTDMALEDVEYFLGTIAT